MDSSMVRAGLREDFSVKDMVGVVRVAPGAIGALGVLWGYGGCGGCGNLGSVKGILVAKVLRSNT